jgi:hypothetical protein
MVQNTPYSIFDPMGFNCSLMPPHLASFMNCSRLPTATIMQGKRFCSMAKDSLTASLVVCLPTPSILLKIWYNRAGGHKSA